MRNKIFSLLSLFFLSTYFLGAQSVDPPKNSGQNKISIRVSIEDTSNNPIFLKQDKLKEIQGMFRNDKLNEVRLRYRDPSNDFWDSEFYDMNFEGDVYVFQNKYKNSIRFLVPQIDVEETYGKKIACLSSKQLRKIIRKDSVIFDFKLECLENDKKIDLPFRAYLGVPAKYFGDLKVLCSAVEKQLTEIDSAVDIDSIVVFRGIVDVSGNMSGLILEAGEQSVFSDAVKDILNPKQGAQRLRARKFWVPARIERGPVKSNIRIYARLNENGSVALSTTRVLGTISVLEEFL